MTYRPLPKQVTIKQSNIEGLGLYSTESLIHGKFLGVSHVANDKFVLETQFFLQMFGFI